MLKETMSILFCLMATTFMLSSFTAAANNSAVQHCGNVTVKDLLDQENKFSNSCSVPYYHNCNATDLDINSTLLTCYFIVEYNISSNDSTVSFSCHVPDAESTTPPTTIDRPSLTSLHIVIAVLTFTNFLLILSVMLLCGVLVCFHKLRTTTYPSRIKERSKDGGRTFDPELKVFQNPTYEQRSIICDQDVNYSNHTATGDALDEVSSHYSTLGPTYDSIRSVNIKALMIPDVAVERKKGRRPMRHTEPVKSTRTYEVYSTDSYGYSRLVKQ